MDVPPKSVLIAENHESNRKLLEVLLSQTGYEVRLAHDGHEALDLMFKAAFDAVIIEWELPLLSGSKFVMLSQLLWPEIPVMILSVHPSTVSEEIHRGAFAWLQKPYNSHELLKTLDAAIHIAHRRSVRSTPIHLHG